MRRGIPWAALFAAIGRGCWFMMPWTMGAGVTFGPGGGRRRV